MAAVHDAGVAHQVLPGRSNHGQLDAVVAQFGAHGGLRFPRLLAPEVTGVPDFRLTVLYPQINWLSGPAFDDDGVIAGALHFRHPEAADLGLGDAAGQGRLGADAVAGRPRQVRPGNRPQGEYQPVVRPQRVRSLFHFLPEVIGHEPGAAEVPPAEQLVKLLSLGGPFTEIYPQDFPVVAARCFSGHLSRLLS